MTTEYAPRLTREGRFSPLILGKLAETFVPRSEWSDPNAFPAYAGTRNRTWKSPVYNPESLNLTRVRELVAQRNTEILFIGDSKIEGAGLLAPEKGSVGEWALPEQVRRALGASEGFVVANLTTVDNRWAIGGMTRSGSDRNCLVPVSLGNPGFSKSAQITTTTPNIGGTMWVQAVGGAALRIIQDDIVLRTDTLPATAGWQPVAFTGASEGNHKYKIETVNGEDVDVLGFTPTYATPGLRISRAGRSSSNASQWLPGAADGHWYSVVESPATSPDIIVIGLGTNNPTDTASIASIYAEAVNLGVPVIAVSPGGLGKNADLSVYAQAQFAIYEAADTHDLPLVDFTALIGDYDKANAAGLMGDTIHENAHGYALEAAALSTLFTAGTSGVSNPDQFYRVSQAAGRTVTVWDYLNNREQMIYGDTGWIDISALCQQVSFGVAFGGGAFLKREGNTVWLDVLEATASGSGTDNDIDLITLDLGYRPVRPTFSPSFVGNNINGRAQITANGAVVIYNTPEGTKVNMSARWNTDDPWPDSLSSS